jgi:glycine cleavage system aminomethyltransferase T
MIGVPEQGDRPTSLRPDVDHPSRQTLISPIPAACVAAGALLGERDGHAIVANYGSVPGEIAVCMKAVGLADRSDLGALELRAAQALLDRVLTARLGDPAVAPGSARRLRDVWYVRLDARRTLLVGPHRALASGPMLGAQAERSDLTIRDIAGSIAIVSLIGPRALRLLGAAGLPDALAIGAVGRDPDDASVLAVVRESQRRVLVIVKASGVDAMWTRLLTAGEPLGAAFVGADALALLGATHTAD